MPREEAHALKAGRRTVVILGAGFAGISCYLRLRERMDRRTTRIVLINRTNYFLFSPLLHEVATGGLGVANAVLGVREIIDRDCADFVQADAVRLDFAGRRVITAAGPVRYDHLVIATGATTDFYGVPGAAEHSYTLKDLADAERLRARLIDCFEDAAATDLTGRPDGKLGFVVVGGGATGVETATEMADLFRHTFKRLFGRHVKTGDVHLTLIHRGERLLERFHEKLGARALEVLRSAGIRVALGRQVTQVSSTGVVLDNGERIAAHTVAWTAGVRAVVPPSEPALPVALSGRIAIDDYFRVPGLEAVWAVGDCAGTAPLLAQAAKREGAAAADNILATLKGEPLTPFTFKSQGDLVSLGRWQAVGDIGRVRWSGRFAWWLWRTVYLFNFPSWTKRLRIAVDWTVNLFHPRDITKA